jgi:hypothetical protein
LVLRAEELQKTKMSGETSQVPCTCIALSLTIEQKSVPVYNIEVFGEHVYEVGTVACLVHNTCPIGGAIFTKAMLNGSEVIAKGSSIRKVGELLEKFGGTAKGWIKKKGWDANGQEWHWYEHHGIGRVGVKLPGVPDPF